MEGARLGLRDRVGDAVVLVGRNDGVLVAMLGCNVAATGLLDGFADEASSSVRKVGTEEGIPGLVGKLVGNKVGESVVGAIDGSGVSSTRAITEGDKEGTITGSSWVRNVGAFVGIAVVGTTVGMAVVGTNVGIAVGTTVGSAVATGATVGCPVGSTVLLTVGGT